ncbi:MAG: tetratricopeptide repeat protein [Streptosporangiaceae bacterium]
MNQPRNFSLHGAVDLGARQAAAQRRQRAAEQGSAADGQPGAQSELIIDVTDESFNTDVVARSRSVPVILDLWAEWCGPCKQLGPILERLATEADGAFVLARVDIDANPQLSAALQVQSIPMVVAVVAGQVVDGFLGAVPEQQVRQWLGQVMHVADQLGLDGAETAAGNGQAGEDAGAESARMPGQDALADAGPNAVFAEAQQAMERGDLDAAAAAFEKILAASPADPIAMMGLGRVSLIRRVEGYDQAAVRRDGASRPGDALAQSRLADLELATGQIETALDRLLATVSRTSGDDRELARKHLLSLFEILPQKDPRVTRARARLSSLLF